MVINSAAKTDAVLRIRCDVMVSDIEFSLKKSVKHNV